MPLNKEAFIALLADKADVSAGCANRMLDAFTEIVAKEMKRGGRVYLRRFGTFDVVKRKARKGTNPGTSEPITIPAKKTVRFKPGSSINSAIS